MFNLDKFIADSVTFRPVSMFAPDIEANKEKLTAEIKGKKVCVIGGAGSIGSSFIKAVLRFKPGKVVVVDLNENGPDQGDRNFYTQDIPSYFLKQIA